MKKILLLTITAIFAISSLSCSSTELYKQKNNKKKYISKTKEKPNNTIKPENEEQPNNKKINKNKKTIKTENTIKNQNIKNKPKNQKNNNETLNKSIQSKLLLNYTGKKWSKALENEMKKIDFSDYNFDINRPKLIKNVNSIYVLVNKANYLPQNFAPINLVRPKTKYMGGGNRFYLREIAAKNIDKLISTAKKNGIVINTVSSYRTIAYQKILFNSYAQRDGIENANKYSAKAGFSEHHTGLCSDVSSPSMNYSLGQNYGNTKEGIALKNNAHKFGFIIRYPKNKDKFTGYTYEPWHLRYVGVELATYLHETNLSFEEFLALQKGILPSSIVIK